MTVAAVLSLPRTAVAAMHLRVSTRRYTPGISTGAETGKVSWYGPKFQGHLTASGSRYDMHALTCAHRTFPLGSVVRVTNLRNAHSVLLRVTDRGPVNHRLIADLSFAAAQALGFQGITMARIELVFQPDHYARGAAMPDTPSPKTVFLRNDLVFLYSPKPVNRNISSSLACIHSIDSDGVITVQNSVQFAPSAYRKPTFEELSQAFIELRGAYERVCDELNR